MKNRDKIDLRREKLRKLLFHEMEEYQYEAYSNNCPESLMNKFNSFSYYNSKKIKKEEEKNPYFNNIINNNKNLNENNQFYNNSNPNIENNNLLDRNNNNNIYQNQENGLNDFRNNNNDISQVENQEQFDFNHINQNNKNNINFNRVYKNESYKYGNTEIDEEINGYNDYYNKLKVDEFMSKKRIQDDLLNQINQKLDKINKNINDKTYQENLAFQYFQNKNKNK